MTRPILTLLLALLAPIVVAAQQTVKPEQIKGTWNGALSIGGTSLPLVIHLTSDESGSLTATMDSPQQGAKGIPVQEVKLTQDSLYLNIRAIGGVYAGKITNAETIDGHWKQSGQAFPMQLKKGAAEAPRRPQEPVKPYPYQEQEVTVENKEAGITLAGTLTVPQGKGNHPAVILFTGSGLQDRDMTVLGHKPFLVLADHLTRQGFAVLRLDDRGAGKSGGNPATATTADFASDAQAAYTFLKSRQEVNPKKIGLLGLSEGALIASKVAAANPDVAFVVLMAGNAVPGTELLVAQNEAIFKAGGVPDATLHKLLKLRRAQFEVAASEANVQTAAIKIKALEQEAKAQMTEQEQKQLGLTPQSEQAIVAQLSSPWMRYYLAYDPAPTLQKLQMPVLALNGSKDLQVPAPQNLTATGRALKAGGNTRSTFKIMRDLNHLFQTAKTGLHTEYGSIEETMSPLALETISTWMKSVVK
ncbi:alpha/beta hydrolase [Pontibacter roseus]|uniref:alpha/beta hydrolase n=1 Tax=Pontibacter roseus TaxID=336989 RepID=UPI0003A2E467|nr:alpha/beta hydrolase [Pontibacter roseus]